MIAARGRIFPATSQASMSKVYMALYIPSGQGLVKVGVTVRDRMAWWFRGAGPACGGCPGVGVGDGV